MFRQSELLESYLFLLVHQYDTVPIQSSVVLCSCPSPSMVRTQTESGTAPVVPSGGSRQGPTMDSTAAKSRPSANSLQHTTQPPPQPRKKRPEDFKFGKILGEGSFSTVSTCCCCLLNECVFFRYAGLLGLMLGDSDFVFIFYFFSLLSGFYLKLALQMLKKYTCTYM